MRRFLAKIALGLVPVLLYCALFVAFEPNNYFGLRAKTPAGAVFGALRAYGRAPTPGVLVGDSRFANLSGLQGLEAETGTAFANLAYGGASMAELLDETRWLLKNHPEIDTVVFEASFYLYNKNYAADRWKFVELGLANPLAYLTNRSYNLEAMQNLLWFLQGQPLGGGEQETRDPASYEYRSWQSPAGQSVTLRADIADYLDDIWGSYLHSWAPNLEAHEALLELIADCRESGVRFVVVLPPVHNAVYEELLLPQGIAAEMAPLVAELADAADALLDYELGERPAYGDEHFYDGFHLDYRSGLPAWQAQLYKDLGERLGT